MTANLVLASEEPMEFTDRILTFNGNYFDIPLLNKYYKIAGLGDLSKHRSLDIFKETKQNECLTFLYVNLFLKTAPLPGENGNHEHQPENKKENYTA